MTPSMEAVVKRSCADCCGQRTTKLRQIAGGFKRESVTAFLVTYLKSRTLGVDYFKEFDVSFYV
ncbi:hypothetical protein CPB84DRAFT_1777892 [Gymnopilus junonius]|uniref:Uncharacterized protein n=1 Tax=Gymnopilus junonius TaxID=109634 RepID=A0A9P5NNF2_GYMJU|nr:hypothetical protein CPB84DRAFT_1777892 [Gymnopilus junonius]